MSGNRRRRLEKLEQKLADLARQEALANCNCQTRIFVNSTKVLEAEMSKTCPAHGFRRLGQITIVQIVPTIGRIVRTASMNDPWDSMNWWTSTSVASQKSNRLRMNRNMTGKNLDSRCKAKTKKGKACRAAATDGGLCFFHANPKKASELGRIGGRSKRPTVPENAEPLPTLNSAVAVRDTVDRLIADVYAGKLHPRIADRSRTPSAVAAARLGCDGHGRTTLQARATGRKARAAFKEQWR